MFFMNKMANGNLIEWNNLHRLCINKYKNRMNTSLGKLFKTVALLTFIFQGCAVRQTQQDVVCIAKTGEKYHRCDCSYLDKGAEQISREDAIQRNFMACSVCNPDKSENSVDSTGTNIPNRPSIPQQQVQEHVNAQCTALTKSGLRCKRIPATNSDKCWQHQ